MALDYSMMRDAVGMDVMNRLSRAQGIGEAAGTLGFLGADAVNQQGGLMQMLNNAKYKMNKPKYDAMYQQGLEDNPYLQGDQTDNFWNEVDALNRDDLNSTTNEVITDSTTMPTETTGFNLDDATKNWNPAFGNTAINDTTQKALDSGFKLNLNKGADGKYVYAPNAVEPGSGVIDPQRGGPMVGAPQDNYVVQPGDTSFDIKNKYGMTMQNLVDQNFGGDLEAAKSIFPGDTLKVNPINTALSNEGSPSLSTGAGSEVNNQQGPLMGLINKGKGALGLNKDEYGRNYWDKLHNYISHDQIAPWNPYWKDNYYGLEFDDQGVLLGDSKYAGQTKETLDQLHPTFGWTTEARGY